MRAGRAPGATARRLATASRPVFLRESVPADDRRGAMTTTATTVDQVTLTFHGSTLVVKGRRETTTIVVRSMYEVGFKEYRWGERGYGSVLPKGAHFGSSVSYGDSHQVWDGSTYVQQRSGAAWYFAKSEGARARSLYSALRAAVSQ